MSDAPKPVHKEKGFSAQKAGARAPSPLMQPEAGNAVTNAVADIVNRTAAPFQRLAPPKDFFDAFSQAQAVVGALAGLANAPTEFLNNAFARATNGISKALPALPAATFGAFALGIPHTHTHPPAMPSPLPGIGRVLTCCPNVLIGGVWAARAGDYGIGPTCGSATPVFEIFTGSSNVFVGGARAARHGDLTRQCMPAPPAAGAAAALSKMQKAMGAAAKVMDGVAKVSKVMGIAGAALKIIDTQMKASDGARAADKAAQAAQDAQDAAEDAKAKAADAAAAATADAISAAAEANAAGLAAVAAGANLAMDMVKKTMGNLMGKDPGAPPCIGSLVALQKTVLIGGFPMPSWSDVAKGLKKLAEMIAQGRRGGAARGRWFCLNCM